MAIPSMSCSFIPKASACCGPQVSRFDIIRDCLDLQLSRISMNVNRTAVG